MTDETLTEGNSSEGAPAPLSAREQVRESIQVTDTEPREEPVKAESPSAEAEPEIQAEPEEERVQKVSEPHQKAFNKLAFEKRELERKLRDAEAREAAREAKLNGTADPEASETPPNGDFVPRAEVERRAAEIAAHNERNRSAEAARSEFDRVCNVVHAKGLERYPEFGAAIQNLAMLHALNDENLEAALATDDPAKVLYEIGKNPVEAERILALPPLKRAVEFAKLAATAAKEAPSKAISKAPPPVPAIAGNNRVSNEPRDEDTDREYIDKRLKQRRENRSR